LFDFLRDFSQTMIIFLPAGHKKSTYIKANGKAKLPMQIAGKSSGIVRKKGFSHNLTTTISSTFIKKLMDNTPGGFGFCFRPRRCGDLRDAIE
jgi:hypothetical protein